MKFQEILEACWSGYQQQGMKKKGDRMVPNCVPVAEVKTGPEMTLNDLLYTAAAKAMHQAGLEGVPMDYEEAIKKAAKIYKIPYIPSELPRLLAQRAEIDRKLAMLKQGKQVAKARRKERLAPTPAGAEEYWKTHALPTDRIKPPAKTLEETEAELAEDLKKWFKEKWVRFGPDGKIRGDCARGSSKEGKPKCLPQSKAHALGKKGRASAAAKKRREDPNPERRGPARNVATKVREGGDDDPIVKALHADDYGMPGTSYSLPKDTKTGYRVSFKGRIIGVFDTMPKATEIAKRLEQKYGGQARVEHTVAEAQTDYQKRRQRERDVDAGRPVKPLPKNPKTDYQKRREKERQELDEKCWPGYEKKGMKTMFGKRYPNCVKKESIDEALAALDSDAVRRIQHMLNVKFDANLDVDGVMGPITVATVKKFLPAMKTSSAPDTSRTTAVQGKEQKLAEKQDACYHKVKSRYKVWPSAYASGALVQCRKKGAANWGTGGKKK